MCILHQLKFAKAVWNKGKEGRGETACLLPTLHFARDGVLELVLSFYPSTLSQKQNPDPSGSLGVTSSLGCKKEKAGGVQCG